MKKYRIRKLTPTECMRLMGVTDEDIQKIKDIRISNSQMYKQAGNSLVSNCVELIFEHLYKSQYDNNYITTDESYISNKNLFGFQMTKKTADEHYQPRIIYLTPNEIRQLYKDPKSIWEESQKWVGDTND